MNLSNVSLFLFVLAFSGMQYVKAGWKGTDHTSDRRLEGVEEYGFVHSIINGTQWCITASGEDAERLVRLELCDIEGVPPAQLWKYQDLQFKSKIDSAQCMRLRSAVRYFGRSRVRMDSCDASTDLHWFYFDGDGQITVREDETKCLTNQGIPPREGAPMIARDCARTNKFIFYFLVHVPDDNTETIGLCNDDAYPKPGCLTIKNEDPQTGQELVLGNPDLNHDWRYDAYGLIHTALDDDMCIQAGDGGPATTGTQMRLYPCDETNPLQLFDYDGVDIELQGSGGLCIGFRGETSHVDVDPLILKDCTKTGNNWSQD